jgi:hypothetical protein
MALKPPTTSLRACSVLDEKVVSSEWPKPGHATNAKTSIPNPRIIFPSTRRIAAIESSLRLSTGNENCLRVLRG